MKISPANIKVNLTQFTGILSRYRGGRQYFTQDIHRLKKRIQMHMAYQRKMHGESDK